MSLIEQRTDFLRKVIDERGDAFVGVEVHFNDRKYFVEGHVLEVNNTHEIIIDIRKTSVRKELRDLGVELPGILILQTSSYSEESGFLINNCNLFITD